MKTQIVIEKVTKQKLIALGKKNQSFDNLLKEILDFVENSDQWWCENR